MNLHLTRIILTTLGAYLLGSISFSFLAGKLQRRDLRRSGSGNLGAMNTARILGPAAGILVLALDTGKGFLAVWLAQSVSSPPLAVDLACIAVMLGHNYSLFLKFSGGKGIAVVGGCLLLISPQTMLAELVVAGVVYLFSRDIHVAGIGMIVAFAPLLGFLTYSWRAFILGIILAGLSAIRHKKDFQNLFQQTG